MIRFLHSSDLHIGKPFGRFDEDLRVRLREARFQKIARLAQMARAQDVSLVMLAGDTFDAQTPPSSLMRQTIRAFAHEHDITWVILPGNHDSLAAEELWARFRRECPENVVLALEEQVLFAFGGNLAILPAPPPVRHPGRDVSAWMDAAETPEDCVRVGLAHGSVQGFGDSGAALGLIAPDRAERARLDYLALGDWHGRVEISPRCHYSGAPEADSFKGHAPASALLVEIAAPHALPKISDIATGDLGWCALEVDFRSGDLPAARLAELLPPAGARRNALVQLVATGHLGLGEQARLLQALEHVEDDFGYFEARLERLGLDHEAGDLEEIDPTSGALREAAQGLLEAADSPEQDATERSVARAALSRLYGYAVRA